MDLGPYIGLEIKSEGFVNPFYPGVFDPGNISGAGGGHTGL